MGIHAEIIEDCLITRSEYLKTIRRRQPIDELKRKVKKSERLKQKIWTEEQIDLMVAESTNLLTKLAPLPLST